MLADVTARANCPTINYVWLEAGGQYHLHPGTTGGSLPKYLQCLAKYPVTRKNLTKIFSHAFAGNDRLSTVRLSQFRQYVCYLFEKYTIRSIVCKGSCHHVIM